MDTAAKRRNGKSKVASLLRAPAKGGLDIICTPTGGFMRRLATVFLFLLWSVSYLPAQNSAASTKQKSMPAQSDARVETAEQSTVNPAKEADIHRLMDLTGSGNLAMQGMTSMEANIRPVLVRALPPGEYREKLVDLFFEKFHTKATPERFLDLAVPIYDKYYSDEEIKGLIQFYETPLGQKTITVLPRLMGELQAAGRSLGEQLGRQSMTEVLAEHPDLAKALNDAKAAALPK
jgi:hypothetical protein